MMSEDPTFLKSGVDVGVDLGVASDNKMTMIPGRIARVLKHGQQVEGILWEEADSSYTLELTTGDLISPEQITPGDNCCYHCDKRLEEGPVGTFYCTCDDWKTSNG